MVRHEYSGYQTLLSLFYSTHSREQYLLADMYVGDEFRRGCAATIELWL